MSQGFKQEDSKYPLIQSKINDAEDDMLKYVEVEEAN
jgi:hypothetical protein